MNPASLSVVLTGAAGGIGAATARALHRAGAGLLLVGRSPQRLAALARELEAGGQDRVAWLAADITTAVGREAIREAASRRQANVLINNAGVPSFGALESLDEAHLEAVLQTNLLAPILLTRLLLPVLQARRPAAVLNVGSTLGRLGLPGYSAYCAAKFGLRGFSESLRRELAGSGVHVQYLGPRATRTAFNDAQVEAFNQATGTASDPPEAVGAAVLRMLRDEAPERFLGLPEKLAVRLNGLVPRWLDGAFRRHAALVRTPAPNR